MRTFIIIIAVFIGVLLGGVLGFFLPLLFAYLYQLQNGFEAGGPASAFWVFCFLTIPLGAIGGGFAFGFFSAAKTKKLKQIE